MATPEEENHQAQRDANEQLEVVNDLVDDLTENEGVVDGELPPGGTEAEQRQEYKDNLEEDLDEIQEAINRNAIRDADKKVRALKKKIRKWRDDTKRTSALEALEKVRDAKRRITAPVIAAAFLPDGGAEVLAAAEAALSVPIESLEIPERTKSFLKSSGIRTIHGLLLRTRGE